ncbi:unnamed protein product [Mesocestoides corti]|uniref:PDZ domain-containing protein n=1 Tax=Mesocestoides corti TaxID=53468 RepID=A0A0R3U288_MESCO|nr:unnamed protein product [Mesocestoides corti]
MAADESQQLRVGDIILSVNGETLESASHDEAVRALKTAGSTICLEVKPLRRTGSFVKRLQAESAASPQCSTSTTRVATDALSPSVFTNSQVRIPLNLVYVERKRHQQHFMEKASGSGESGCCIELFSPDLTQSCLLCTGSPRLASVWFASLSRQISILNQISLNGWIKVLPQFQLRKIGWVLELDRLVDDSNSCLAEHHHPSHLSASPCSSGSSWQPVFLAVTDRLLLMYSQAPYSPEDWHSPLVSAALITTRVVNFMTGLSGKFHPNQDWTPRKERPSLHFTIRTGRKYGVESHTFAAPTSSELEDWLQVILTSTRQALLAAPQVAIKSRWRGLDTDLVLHRIAGISLFRAGSSNCSGKLIWAFPFERELELPGGTKPVIFVLLNILSTRLVDRKYLTY